MQARSAIAPVCAMRALLHRRRSRSATGTFGYATAGGNAHATSLEDAKRKALNYCAGYNGAWDAGSLCPTVRISARRQHLREEDSVHSDLRPLLQDVAGSRQRAILNRLSQAAICDLLGGGSDPTRSIASINA